LEAIFATGDGDLPGWNNKMSIADSIMSDHAEFRGMIAALQKTSTKDFEERRRTFSDLKKKVSAHFLAEEDTVIKEMAKLTELRPLALELTEEHQAIRDLFDVLWATNCDDEIWLPRLAPISELLTIHMGKEENVVIPAAPKYFTDAQLEALGRVFDKVEAKEMDQIIMKA
jgi:hemerythrin superfamily protein